MTTHGFASPIPRASHEGWRRLAWLPDESTQSIAVPRVAPSVCRREIAWVKWITALGQADDVMRGAGQPVPRAQPGQHPVDRRPTEGTGGATCLRFLHAPLLGCPPRSPCTAPSAADHLSSRSRATGRTATRARSAADALAVLLLAAVPRCDAPGAHARQPHADRAERVRPSRTGRQRATRSAPFAQREGAVGKRHLQSREIPFLTRVTLPGDRYAV
jgi:hypothetical protein